MVKKLIATLTGLEDAWPDGGRPSDNEQLFNLLQHYRDLIGDNFGNKKWDRNKKLANQYELVYTMFFGYPSVSNHIPISRSFFKMWEIMHDSIDTMPFLTNHQPMKAVFLAEGPGGFMEAFMKKRAETSSLSYQDRICGMTLISPDNTVPRWKSDRLRKDYHCTIHFETGADGTGSLYSMDNINSLVHNMGASQCDLVTADGGFDFSTDFNNQETLSQKLIACEILAAIKLQKINGAFVLKIYDIYNPATFQLLWILKQCYQNLSIHKPLTSRPANSEKYVVCTGFAGADPRVIELLTGFCTCTLNITLTCLLQTPPSSFIQTVTNVNHYFVTRQIVNINRTLMLIKKDKKEISSYKDVVREQLTKAIKWCNKYHMPINVQALKEYRSFVY